MNNAQRLLTLLRANQIAINKFLDLALIPRRDFYAWVQGDRRPTQRATIKLQVACDLLEKEFL